MLFWTAKCLISDSLSNASLFTKHGFFLNMLKVANLWSNSELNHVYCGLRNVCFTLNFQAQSLSQNNMGKQHNDCEGSQYHENVSYCRVLFRHLLHKWWQNYYKNNPVLFCIWQNLKLFMSLLSDDPCTLILLHFWHISGNNSEEHLTLDPLASSPGLTVDLNKELCSYVQLWESFPLLTVCVSWEPT